HRGLEKSVVVRTIEFGVIAREIRLGQVHVLIEQAVVDRAMVDARHRRERQTHDQAQQRRKSRVSHGCPSLLLHSQTEAVTALPSTTANETRLPIEVTSASTLPFAE